MLRPLAIALVFVGCQADAGSRVAGGSGSAAATTTAREIAFVDEAGNTVSTISLVDQPCRVGIEGRTAMIVGLAPIVSQVGATRFTGEIAANGTTFFKDGTKLARLWSDKPTELSLIDPEGIAIMRATSIDGRVQVGDRQGTIVRYVQPQGDVLLVIDANADSAALGKIIGTKDALLGALLTATEASPEVRGLAACHRLFPIEGK